MSKSFLKTFYRDFLSSDKKPRERNSPKGLRPLGNPGGGGAFALLEAQKLRTHGIFHNARHIKRAAFLGGGLLFL